MIDRDKIPDITLERAVELWCRALKNPRYDNGDKSQTGFMSMALQTLAADKDLKKVWDFSAAVERFRSILLEKLKWLQDHDGEPGGEIDGEKRAIVYFPHHIGCDYNPDPVLREAAAAAGIPESAFSWKSHVGFYRSGFVTASFGYRAPTIYHYPLTDGSWLLCSLSGEDMPAIIRAVEAGQLPELTVEKPVEVSACQS